MLKCHQEKITVNSKLNKALVQEKKMNYMKYEDNRHRIIWIIFQMIRYMTTKDQIQLQPSHPAPYIEAPHHHNHGVCDLWADSILITDTEGSSAVLKGAFVTYCNEAKIMQGVPAEIIDRYTVYSNETAGAMAQACRKAYNANIGIGVTGTMGNVDPANP